MTKVDYSAIPSVDTLLQSPSAVEFIRSAGREMALKAIRQIIQNIRKEMRNSTPLPNNQAIISSAEELVQGWLKPTLYPVINASGIILHTNLGRAPLSPETIQAMEIVSASYSNLEFDLQKGKRGKRSVHAEALLQKLTGADNALVVNNNAGAVLLILSALAKRKKVIIPHSQLVEIGGGFRVPDVMRQSGAKLTAIGTTNRIHLTDYRNALEDGAALVLNAHHSNFKIIGFTTEPELAEVAALAHEFSTLFVHDLGSGVMLDTSEYGLAHEPTVQEDIAADVDVICFSGDKLLGGPQAGIIIGKAEPMAKIKRHPLARALRADKTCLAGVAAVLTHYLKDEAVEKIPVWRMIARDLDSIKYQANKWMKKFQQGEVIAGNSMIGGGSLPGENLPTALYALDVEKPDQFLAELRCLPVPIIARIEKDRVLFDPRTILPEQENIMMAELEEVFSKPQKI